jgi:acetyl-CoA carboxylase biotin carboxyl carrier protein
MTFEEIKALIQLVNKSDLAEFKFEDGDQKVVIRTSKYSNGKQQFIQPSVPLTSTFSSAPAMTSTSAGTAVSNPIVSLPKLDEPTLKSDSTAATTEGSGDYLEIKSPIVGTFYRSAGPDKGPYVKVGDTVDKGSVVCIVEAMKLFNEIESEVKGKIVKIVAEDASPVEYDQVLFLVDPKG